MLAWKAFKSDLEVAFDLGFIKKAKDKIRYA